MHLEIISLLQQFAGVIADHHQVATNIIHHTAVATPGIDHHTAMTAMEHTTVPTVLDIALATPPHIVLTDNEIKEVLTLVLAGTTASLASDMIEDGFQSSRNQLVNLAGHKLDGLQRDRDQEKKKLDTLLSQDGSQSTKAADQTFKKIKQINRHVKMVRSLISLLSSSSNMPNVGSLALAFD